MKSKILNALLIITSLFGYLEWSGNSHSFLFEAEGEILAKLFSDPFSVVHPFTILPMLGQIMLIITLFQKSPNRILTFTGIGALGLLIVFMFLIGILSFNYKIIISTLPFIILSIITIRHYRKGNKELIKT